MAMPELSRRVGSDCAVEMDTNAYSVPWRLIGERVRVLVTAETGRVTHAGVEVACHRRSAGRHGRIVDRAHFEGVAGAAGRVARIVRVPGYGEHEEMPVPVSVLLRPFGGVRSCGRRGLVMGVHTQDDLDRMLTQRKLTAMRDQLDSLLDEAVRGEMTLRDALAFLCEREIAREDHRRIDMSFGLLRSPSVAASLPPDRGTNCRATLARCARRRP